MNVPSLDWNHILTEGAVIVVPILIGGYVAFKRITWYMREFRLHNHGEKKGPLQAEGIIYPRGLNGD